MTAIICFSTVVDAQCPQMLHNLNLHALVLGVTLRAPCTRDRVTDTSFEKSHNNAPGQTPEKAPCLRQGDRHQ